MTASEHESLLPKVDLDDIRHLVFDDVTNTDHIQRWEEFATTHPILADELRARIYSEARSSVDYDKNSEDIRIRLMNTVMFAVNALEHAARRSRIEVPPIKSDDVDDEGLQPSA